MSSVANFPNPCLVAILLVCNTRAGSGAQVLFNYPSTPLSQESVTQSFPPDDAESDSSADSDESSTDEDKLFALPRATRRPELRLNKSRTRSGSDEEGSEIGVGSINQNGNKLSITEPLFGLAEDGLISLLTPDPTWHKRKFEMGINNLTFIGRPLFARHDGTWAKRKIKRQRTSEVEAAMSDTMTGTEDEHDADRVSTDRAAAADKQSTKISKSPLTMFHVVFVMNPPPLEATQRLKDMYDHVIKKFSRALKWDQVRNDYVWKQSELILSLKSSASAKKLSRSSLSAVILEKSSLAVAISTVYHAISSSRIASVTLSPKVSLSLQIPPTTSTAYLPSLTDPPIPPGLWLTTATDVGSNNADNDASSPENTGSLAKHYTLLLKSPPRRIVKDAQDAGGPLAQHLPRFVSALRPTKSFYKLSATSQISLADIQLLARHLIYWRRAVAIPPLHQKDTYIVSPNADLSKLRDSMKSYEQQFPSTMPSLPKMLSALSGVPRPFGNLIPSSDHKETYYWALAWLMRHGWVTQLRTFAYVRVESRVKRAIKDAERDLRMRSPNKPTNKDGDEAKEPTRSSFKRPSMASHASSEGRVTMDIKRSIQNYKQASLVLNPPRASSEESKWLDYISDSLFNGDAMGLQLSPEERAELKKHWPAFVNYFNGQVALETIPVRRNLKRKYVWALLDALGARPSRGIEEEDREHQSILLTVRHW